LFPAAVDPLPGTELWRTDGVAGRGHRTGPGWIDAERDDRLAVGPVPGRE
jgi:hypothetical protein